MELVFDIEASGLLDNTTIDYTASPYKLKLGYLYHCMVVFNRTTQEWLRWEPHNFHEGVEYIKQNATTLIGANIIDYDLLALKLGFDFDYTIQPDTICGRPCKIIDTLVMSKTLNPDRLGHSIDWWGEKLGFPKIDWRAKAVELGLIGWNAPKGAEFQTYHPEMLVYNERDVLVTNKKYEALLAEAGDWPWHNALDLEHAVRDIITKQSHRGFWFNREKAEENVRELDALMAECRSIVEPVLPEKIMPKTRQADSMPPKNQFKKDGSISALMVKFADKMGGIIEGRTFLWNGKTFELPMALEPIITTEKANIEDTTHIKGWLIELGWEPVNYKERDLTVDSKKKKLSKEKYTETVHRYWEQTVGSSFERDRVAHLTSYLRCSKAKVLEKLLAHDITRPMKVLTNPTFTVGQEKELCPNLELLAEKFPYAEHVVKFLTYRHRRNSILGGGVSLEDDEEEIEKGFLANVRDDGRIATPADTCGAGTSRFKHRQVANIPRVTSMYGKEMRQLFGVDKGFYQLGYDFDSLEARIEADGCWKYDPTKEYCQSLIQPKPHDCHTKLAEYITELLGKPFGRGPSKNVKYGCAYNAQAPRIAKTIGESLEVGEIVFNAYWEKAFPLKALKEKMQKYWETTGQKKFLLGIDGRKLPIRAKGNCINSRFQSSGVICAKRAMVIHDRKLKAHGLGVDFFRDNWKNKTFVNQLVAYHDEVQLEVSRSLVKWKMFNTEEEAKKFKETSQDWSDIGHNEKGWYVGYCLAGKLAVESVKEAGEYYKLNIELTAGYMLGVDWASCH